jgi:ribonuclease T2
MLLASGSEIVCNTTRRGPTSGLGAGRVAYETSTAPAFMKIPPEYTNLQEPLNVTPTAVEAAFIKANPNLSTESMAIECDKKWLTGVRICLSKELQFRSCAQIARRSCRREPLIMPPQR